MNMIGTFLKVVAFDARIVAKILNLVTCFFFKERGKRNDFQWVSHLPLDSYLFLVGFNQ